MNKHIKQILPYVHGTVKEKLYWALVKNVKEEFVQNYCNRGEKSTLLKQKAGRLVGMTKLSVFADWRYQS